MKQYKEYIFIFGYFILLPLMKLPKIKAEGILQAFFSKIGYADIFLFLFSIIYFKKIFYWIKATENSKCRNILIGIIICWSISTLFSFHKFISLLDVIGLFMLIGLFILLSQLVNSHNRFLLLNRVNLYVATIVSIIGIMILVIYLIYPFNLLGKFILLKSEDNAAVFFPRISSTLTLPEMLITYLNVALVSGFILYVYKMDKIIFWCIGVIIIAACLAYSRSLAGLFVTFSLILFAFKFESLIYNISRRLFRLFAILFLIITITFSFYRVYSFETVSMESIKGIQYGHEDRYYMTGAVFRIFYTSPFLGIGPGSYTFEANKYISQESIYKKDLSIISKLSDEKSLMDPHSLYLGLISETGILGSIFVLLFICYLFFENHKIITRNPADTNVVRTHRILEAGLIGMLITGLFVDILSMRHFWILLAMIYASTKINKKMDCLNSTF